MDDIFNSSLWIAYTLEEHSAAWASLYPQLNAQYEAAWQALRPHHFSQDEWREGLDFDIPTSLATWSCLFQRRCMFALARTCDTLSRIIQCGERLGSLEPQEVQHLLVYATKILERRQNCRACNDEEKRQCNIPCIPSTAEASGMTFD